MIASSDQQHVKQVVGSHRLATAVIASLIGRDVGQIAYEVLAKRLDSPTMRRS
jgi:hypothetical protein